jgi:hypothetical protein
MQPKIEISVELLNAVLNYLGTKPFVEVAGLINGIQEQAKGQLPETTEAVEE